MRITGGELRSRRLSAPKGSRTRPTSDRVREALFSVLGGYVEWEGLRVLDVYAGTGALAFEALSRGASEAVLVERARDAVSAIRQNVTSLGLASRVELLATDANGALSTLAQRGRAFELVFADPPYADVRTGDAQRTLACLEGSELLVPGGLLVLEHDSGDEPGAVGSLEPLIARRYGDTAIGIYARRG